MIDQAQDSCGIEADHLGTDVVAHQDARRAIYRMRLAARFGDVDCCHGTQAIKRAGLHFIAHGLAVLLVDAGGKSGIAIGCIFVELVTASDGLIACSTHVIGKARQFVLGGVSAGIGLQQLPFRFDLVGFSISPVRTRGKFVRGYEIPQFDRVCIMGGSLDDLHPGRFAKLLTCGNRHHGSGNHGNHLRISPADRGRIIPCRRSDLDRRSEGRQWLAGATIYQPVVDDIRRGSVVANAEMFTAFVDRRVGAGMALEWRDRRYRLIGQAARVGHAVGGAPIPARVWGAFITHEDLRIRWIGIVLANLRRAVVVPVKGLADVGAVNTVDLDFETVADLTSVVEGVEVAQVTDHGGGPRNLRTKY